MEATTRMKVLSSARVYKTNMTDIMDEPVCIKSEATSEYFRQLESRAKAKGIHTGKSGIDKCNGIWFEVEKDTLHGVKTIRYTFITGKHDMDSIAII